MPPGLPPGVAYDESVPLTGLYGLMLKLYCGLVVVGDLVVAGVEQRALGQRIRVADLVLHRARVVALYQTRNARAGRRRARAVVGLAVEQVRLARAEVGGEADAEEVALQVAAGGHVVLQVFVHAADAHDAEAVGARDRNRRVVKRAAAGCRRRLAANAVVAFVADTQRDRAVVVQRIRAEHARMRRLGIRRRRDRGTRLRVLVALRAVLDADREAGHIRRIEADRIGDAVVEAAGILRLEALRPQLGRRQDRRRQGRDVTEDRVQIVVRHQEAADLDRAPTALQADERFATGQRATRLRRVDRRLNLENRIETAAEGFRAAKSEARRVRTHPVLPRIGQVAVQASRGNAQRSRGWLRLAVNVAVHEFHVEIDAAIQRDVCRLRLCQRRGEHACDGQSDQLFVHELSPLTDKIGKETASCCACHRNLLSDVEKLDSLCQRGRARGKANSRRAARHRCPVAKTRQEMPLCGAR